MTSGTALTWNVCRGQTAGGSEKAVLSSEHHNIGAQSTSDSTVASGRGAMSEAVKLLPWLWSTQGHLSVLFERQISDLPWSQAESGVWERAMGVFTDDVSSVAAREEEVTSPLLG